MEVTQQEQRSFVKIVVLWGRNAKECYSELTEALGNCALPYRTVARWAAAFQHGRVASADMRQTGHPRTVHTDVTRAVIAQCLEDDRRWSLQELQAHKVLIRQLCIKSYKKICICVRLLQSGCHMHLLNNKNGVAMKLVVYISKGTKMKETTCWTLSLLMKHGSGLMICGATAPKSQDQLKQLLPDGSTGGLVVSKALIPQS